MKKGSYWFSLLTEKQQSEFRANCKNQYDNFAEIMNQKFDDLKKFVGGTFNWAESSEGNDYWMKIYQGIDTELNNNIPKVHTHFHIVYLTGENKCTGVNIQAVDMIDALKQFESKNNGVKPIYCYAK